MRSSRTLILLAIVLAGCDIPGRLFIKNKSDSSLHVTIMEPPTGDQNGRHEFDGATYVNTDTAHVITFLLTPHKRTQVYGRHTDYGWTWSDANIQRYVQDLKRMEYITSEDSIAVMSDETLTTRLRQGRRGLIKKSAVLRLP